MDGSQFENFSKKQLVYICQNLIDGGFDYNIYKDFDENYDILQTNANYFGVNVNNIDVEFFGKLLELNDELLADYFQTSNDFIIDDLEIPKIKKFKVEYNEYGTASYTSYYQDKVHSYDENWVIKGLRQDEVDGTWNTWDGTLVDTEYDNHEGYGETSFSDVEEITD
jgi:hypothetical protein